MLECPSCRRLYPEVGGAPTQVCPHCQHETTIEGDEPAGAKAPARDASAIPADAVGAIQLGWRVARASPARLLVLCLPAVMLGLGVDLAITAYESSAGLPIDYTAWTLSQQMRYLGVALPLYVVRFTATLATWTFVAAHVLDLSTGSARLEKGRSLLVPAVALGFALALALAAGAILLLVGLFVVLHWFMFAPAKLAQGEPGVGAAFDASRRFSRARKAYGFTALVVFAAILSSVPSFLGLPGTSGLVVATLLRWLFSPVVPVLIASFVALSAGEVKLPAKRPREAPTKPTTQEAKPAERVGRTACPSCGTPISYTPTGFPVDVVCPSCGKAGRVL